MACNKPILLYFPRGNDLTNVRSSVPVPCGHCAACRRDLVTMWSDRCTFEVMEHKEPSSFVTLTYNDDNVPNGGNVCPDDWHKFLDRLRKNLGHSTRYYMSSEYGEKTYRPHYHAMLFGFDWQKKANYDALFNAWSPRGKEIGFFSVDYLNPTRIRYCLKYMAKERNSKFLADISSRGLAPLFHRMSKGIGKSWFFKHINDIVRDHGYYVNGKLRPLPRYYADLLGALNENHVPDFNKYVHRFMDSGMYWSPYEVLTSHNCETMFHNDVKERQMEHLDYIYSSKYKGVI